MSPRRIEARRFIVFLAATAALFIVLNLLAG
jgi:hypothetical protein